MWIKVFMMFLDLVALMCAIYVRSIISNKDLMEEENKKLLEKYREEGIFADKTDEEVMEELRQMDKVGKVMSLVVIVFLMFGFVIFGQYL